MGIFSATRDVTKDVKLPVFVISTGPDRHPIDPWFVGSANAFTMFLSCLLNIVDWRVYSRSLWR